MFLDNRRYVGKSRVEGYDKGCSVCFCCFLFLWLECCVTWDSDLIQCNKCHCQYIGEPKRKLSERFGEHRRYILNHHQLSNPTPVSLHFNQPGHSINDVHLIPLKLIRSNHNSVRKVREAHLIIKAKTLHPFGMTKHANDISRTCN